MDPPMDPRMDPRADPRAPPAALPAAGGGSAQPRRPAPARVSHRRFPIRLHGRLGRAARLRRAGEQWGEGGLHDAGLPEFVIPQLLHVDDR